MEKRHPMTGADGEGTWPLRAGGTTGWIGSFGYSRNSGQTPHWGVDFLADIWQPVFAAHDGGLVRDGFQTNRAGREVNKGYGSRVSLRDAKRVETRYAHLVHQVYRSGMLVKAGEIIGYVGRTGNVDHDCPTHLHFEVRVYSIEKQEYLPVNPIWWMTGEGLEHGMTQKVVDYM